MHRAGDESPRRAAGGFVGDSDVVRVARGAAARHRGAERRRRRRDFRRATTSATCRTRWRHAARRVMPDALSPAAAWLGTRWPRRRGCRSRLRVGTLAGKPRARSGGRLLRGPRVPEAGGRAQPDGSSPEPRSVEEPGVRGRSPSRTGAVRRTDAVQRAEYADLKIYMPNDPLVKVDRMSMAHGLEVRCPLLDRRVVELAFRIPASRKQQGTQGKALLRALARRRLPGGAVAAPEARIHRADRRMDRRAVCVAVPRRSARAATPRSRSTSTSKSSNGGLRPTARDGADHAFTLWSTWVLERWLARTATAKTCLRVKRRTRNPHGKGRRINVIYSDNGSGLSRDALVVREALDWPGIGSG